MNDAGYRSKIDILTQENKLLRSMLVQAKAVIEAQANDLKVLLPELKQQLAELKADADNHGVVHGISSTSK